VEETTMSPIASADLFDAYLDELLADGVSDPLHELFTLGAVLDDLSRLAGVDRPEPVAFVEEPAVAWCGDTPPF
jgi:hypothetical protein